MGPGIFVERLVVCARIRPVDGRRPSRVVNERFQEQVVPVARIRDALLGQFNAWGQGDFHLVAEIDLTFLVCKAKFIEAKIGRPPCRVVLRHVGERALCRSFHLPLTECWLHRAERGLVVNDAIAQIVDLIAGVGNRDAVGHAVEHREAEVLVVLGVVADKFNGNRVSIDQGQVLVVVHVGKTSAVQGHDFVGRGAVLVNDVNVEERPVPPTDG